MNALLNIAIRVTTQGAQQLANLQRRLVGIQAASAGNAGGALGVTTTNMNRFVEASQRGAGAMGGFSSNVGRAASSLQNFGRWLHDANGRLGSWGKNLQWSGQQLTMRFTLPVAAAAYFGAQAWMENERALTRLRKVYDEYDPGAKTAELEVLGEIALELSNKFGVAREEVTGTMAAFAQAGASGAAVAKLTRQAIELSILADYDLATATQHIIVMQQQYRLSTDELRVAIAQLNAVENATAVNTEDLLTAIQRAGSTAATSGVEIYQLGALIAGLVPAHRTAAQAGNSLRSIWVRLSQGAKDTTAGIQAVIGAQRMQEFQTASGIRQLQMLADGFKGLADSERVFRAGQIAGTYQAGAFLGIMEQLNNSQSAYNVALREGGDVTRALETYYSELMEAMESEPRKADIAMNQMRNSIAMLVAEAMPSFVQLLGVVSMLVQGFQSLSPETRQWIIIAALALAVIGPLVSYLGSMVLLVSTLIRPVIALGQAFAFLAPQIIKAAIAMVTFFLAHPYVALAAVIIAALVAIGVAVYVFRDDIKKALGAVTSDVSSFVSRIASSFVELFSAVGSTVGAGVRAIFTIFKTGLTALASFISSAVMTIYKLLSYLNPFARHSPSLVEEVDAGIDRIVAKFGELDGIAAPLRAAAADLRAFREAMSEASAQLDAKEIAEQRSAVGSFSPGALPAFDNLVASMRNLRAQLPGLSSEIAAQTDAVERLESAMDALDREIKSGERALDGMREALSAIGDELNAAQDRLNRYANASIAGSRVFSDAIFNNEMHVKQLRLELMKLEDAHPEIEDLTDRFNALNGAIEEARGREKDLRLMGAGSDVLGPLQQQISQMEAARDAMMDGAGSGPAAEMEALRTEIERLEREGERLDLEESLKFDPLRRQIELLVDGMNELPFDEIVAGIQREQTNIARLTHQYDQQEAAVKAQEKAVESLRDQRDRLSDQLDVEKSKLEALRQIYSQIEAAIREIEQELSRWEQAAKAASSAAAGGAGEAARAIGDLEEAFGSGIGGMEGGLSDLQKILEDLQKEAKERTEKFKEDLERWLESALGKLEEFKNRFIGVFTGITEFIKGWVINPFRSTLTTIISTVQWVYETVRFIISLLITVFVEFPLRVMTALAGLPGQLLQWATGMMTAMLERIRQIGGQIFDWFANFPNVVKGYFANAATWLLDAGLAIMSGLFWALGNAFGPIGRWFGEMGATIYSYFRDAGEWLVNAGKAIMRGLYNGIMNAPYDIAGAILGKIPSWARGALPSGNRLSDEEFRRKYGSHSGGVAGFDLPQSLHRPQGLRADEYTRILRKGETVFTQGQMKALGGLMGGGGGARTIVINGNLEFPNITDGNDAEEFIRNLEGLAQ